MCVCVCVCVCVADDCIVSGFLVLLCMASTLNLAFRPSFWLIPLSLAHIFSFEPSARYYVYLGD